MTMPYYISSRDLVN